MKKMSSNVGIYHGAGASKEYVEKHWSKLIKGIRLMTSPEFTKCKLDELGVIILPGGSGSKTCQDLGENGRQSLIDWVHSGGTIIGVCAGMFCMLDGYEWSMNLINYELVDKSHWIRGKEPVTLSITDGGRKFLGLRRKILENVPYHNGPVVQRIEHKNHNVFNERIIAIFEDDWPPEGGSPGLMKGTPAIVSCDYGNGHVVAFSPHLERHSDYKKIIKKLIVKIIS